MGDGTKTIAEVTEAYGVSRQTLEFYEAQGLLTPVHDTFRPYYSPADCARLELILKGKKLGFSLAELRKLMAHHAASETDLAKDVGVQTDQAELQAQIDRLHDRRDKVQEAIDALQEALRNARG